MQTWRTKRRNEYSVHMTAEELAALIDETAEALNLAFNRDVSLPSLARLHHKLFVIQGAKEGTRA